MLNLSLQNLLYANVVAFITLVLIIAFLLFKLNPKSKLEKARDVLKEEIEKSNKDRENSIEVLGQAEENLKNVEAEVHNIIENAEKLSSATFEKTQDEIQKGLEDISKSSEKMLAEDILRLKHETISEVSSKTLESAKNNIKKMLVEDEKLHLKFIDEAIDKIKEVQF